MKKILLISGHKNIQSLTDEGLREWRDVEALKKSTGASGELVYQWEKIAPALKAKLSSYFEVTVTDAIYHKDVYNKDYDLVLALHYDGGGEENRSMISAPNKEMDFLEGKAQTRAEEIAKVFREKYASLTGTVNRDNRITLGMTDYYGWDYVSYNSPSVLLEEFNHTSAKGAELKTKPEIVVNAIYQCVLSAFNVVDTSVDPRISELEKAVSEMRDSRDKWKKEAKELQKDCDALKDANEKLTTRVNKLLSLEEKNKELQAKIDRGVYAFSWDERFKSLFKPQAVSTPVA